MGRTGQHSLPAGVSNVSTLNLSCVNYKSCTKLKHPQFLTWLAPWGPVVLAVLLPWPWAPSPLKGLGLGRALQGAIPWEGQCLGP